MYLGRVTGRLVATTRYPGLEGVPLQLVQPLDECGADMGGQLVCCAVVPSGPGDLVHFVDGREAALACPETFVPVDATILGVVEQLAHVDDRAAGRGASASGARAPSDGHSVDGGNARERGERG